MSRATRWALMLVLTAAVGCRGASVTHGTAEANAPPVRAEMLVSSRWLSENLRNPSVVVLHVAKVRKGYDAGHIPGARLVEWRKIAVTRDDVPNEFPPANELAAFFGRLGVGDAKRIVLYDEGLGILAARACVTLDYLGLGDRAALLDGGWKKWRAEKRPVSTEEPKVKPASFEPRLRPETVVKLDEMRAILKGRGEGRAGAVSIVDARNADEYSGKIISKGARLAGHIRGAVNVSARRIIAGGKVPVFRPAGELHALFRAAGVKGDDTVVTYCRSDLSASLVYFALKYLGRDVRLYDGSFVEWSRAKDAPVERGAGHAVR